MGYIKSYVAFLDILGFKDFIGTSAFEDVMKVFTMITEGKSAKMAIYRACDESDNELVNYNMALDETKINIMSDSIVISTPCNFKESLSAIIDMCFIIQYYLLECDMPIFLRGAIAKGDMYHNEEMMFGKGMIDAYIAQEEISKYPRIILSKELVQESEDVAVLCGEKSKIILGKDGYYYIDCLYEYLDTYNEDLFAEKCYKIRNYINSYLKRYISNRIREKMLWLIEQYNRCVLLICQREQFNTEKYL